MFLHTLSLHTLPLLIGMLLIGSVAQDEDKDKATVEISHEGQVYLSLPKPPENFKVVQHLIENDGKVLGITTAIARDTPGSVAVVMIEFRDLPSVDHRRTTAKAYINAGARSLTSKGYRIVDQTLPDLEKADFGKPIKASFDLLDPAGNKVFYRKRIFFTTIGYDVSVLATSEDELKMLSEWAEGIQPPKKDK